MVPGVRDSGSARVGEVVVTGGGNGSIARWVMGEQKAIVVESGLTKPRVVMCVGARVLVMGDQGELVSYNTRTNRCSRLCSSVPGIILSSWRLMTKEWSCVAWWARRSLTCCSCEGTRTGWYISCRIWWWKARLLVRTVGETQSWGASVMRCG